MNSVRLDSIDAKVWAEHVLSAQSNAEGELRLSVIRQLAESDLLPEPAFDAAVRIDGRSFQLLQPSLQAFVLQDLRRRTKIAIDSFAGVFFSIPLHERLERRDQLLRMAEPFPDLTARLEQLQVGMSVTQVDLDQAPFSIRRTVCELATMITRPPYEWSGRREALLASLRRESVQLTALFSAVDQFNPLFGRLLLRRTPPRRKQFKTHTEFHEINEAASSERKSRRWLAMPIGAIVIGVVLGILWQPRRQTQFDAQTDPSAWLRNVSLGPIVEVKSDCWLARRFAWIQLMELLENKGSNDGQLNRSHPAVNRRGPNPKPDQPGGRP